MRSVLPTIVFWIVSPGLQLAGVDAQENQVAVLLADGLERQAGERLAVERLAFGLVLLLGLAGRCPHGRAIHRRRQIIAHRVQQQPHAVVFLRRAAMHRRQLAVERAGCAGPGESSPRRPACLRGCSSSSSSSACEAASSRCSRHSSACALYFSGMSIHEYFMCVGSFLSCSPHLHANEVDDALEVARSGRPGWCRWPG